ncbi:polysaccharide deacetylase family protein [Streptomyces sp. NPDC059373]
MALTTSAKGTCVVLAATIAGAALAACGTQHGTHGTHGTSSGSAALVAPWTSAPPSAVARTHPAPTPRPDYRARHDFATPSAVPASPSRAAEHSGPSAASRQQRADDGKASSGPATAGTIEDSVAGGGRSVALTFDDGPDPRWTPQILALLAQHHAKATFCEIGPNAQANPDLVKKITAAGDRLCDHSVHHDEAQSHKSFSYNEHEIVDAQHEIGAAAGTGAKLWYYRAPGGDFSPAIRGIAADHGLRPLGWSVDSEDWKRPGVNVILNNINAELKPGAIVLMHDGGGDRSQTVEALGTLLDRLDAAGYTYAFPQR